MSSAILRAIIGCMNPYPKAMKGKAQKLRRDGSSYGEISKKTGIPKSTLSLWLKDIPLDQSARDRLYTKKIEILTRGPNSQRERRKREIQSIVQQAEREIAKPISIESFRLFGAALYWAEGDKTQKFGFTNSDPHFILFMTKWLEKIFEIRPTRLKATLNMYPQQNEVDLKKFWSQLTGIPVENFYKSFIKPPNKAYKKNNLYYGTIKIYIPKGIDLRYKVYGWIKSVMNEFTADAEIVQKEWRFLKEVARPINLPEEIIAPP